MPKTARTIQTHAHPHPKKQDATWSPKRVRKRGRAGLAARGRLSARRTSDEIRRTKLTPKGALASAGCSHHLLEQQTTPFSTHACICCTGEAALVTSRTRSTAAPATMAQVLFCFLVSRTCVCRARAHKSRCSGGQAATRTDGQARGVRRPILADDHGRDPGWPPYCLRARLWGKSCQDGRPRAPLPHRVVHSPLGPSHTRCVSPREPARSRHRPPASNVSKPLRKARARAERHTQEPSR